VSYMSRDYSVDCNSPRYQKFAYYVYSMVLIYPIGSKAFSSASCTLLRVSFYSHELSTGSFLVPLMYSVLIFQRKDILCDEVHMLIQEDDNFPGPSVYFASYSYCASVASLFLFFVKMLATCFSWWSPTAPSECLDCSYC